MIDTICSRMIDTICVWVIDTIIKAYGCQLLQQSISPITLARSRANEGLPREGGVRRSWSLHEEKVGYLLAQSDRRWAINTAAVRYISRRGYDILDCSRHDIQFFSRTSIVIVHTIIIQLVLVENINSGRSWKFSRHFVFSFLFLIAFSYTGGKNKITGKLSTPSRMNI